jgi:hypothetical protein
MHATTPEFFTDDYERRLDVSEAMIYLAMGNLLVRRISHP